MNANLGLFFILTGPLIKSLKTYTLISPKNIIYIYNCNYILNLSIKLILHHIHIISPHLIMIYAYIWFIFFQKKLRIWTANRCRLQDADRREEIIASYEEKRAEEEANAEVAKEAHADVAKVPEQQKERRHSRVELRTSYGKTVDRFFV